jgi:hypothetical protein
MAISVVLVPFDESTPLETRSVSWDEDDSFQETIQSLLGESYFLETPLLRPRGNVAGLYAYYNVPDDVLNDQRQLHNIRATRLAMACGLLSLRFYGPVLLVRSFGGRWEDLSIGEIEGACCISPDLRLSIQEELAQEIGKESPKTIPAWLADAAQHNYHDGAALAQVAAAMNVEPEDDGDEEEDEHDDESEDDDSDTASVKKEEDTVSTINKTGGLSCKEFVTKSPLCLHCRGLSSCLCPDCEGAYFCQSPRNCRTMGWSHFCLCQTWKLYSSDHRHELSTFSCFGDDWQSQLFGRGFQTQEYPYEVLLKSLGIDRDCESWWRTEMDGWAGGQSQSATTVDASIRRSYAEGFAPIADVPRERRICQEDLERCLGLSRNSVGLLALSSWKDYYRLRDIPEPSPVALLCTFPLTIYYAIERYGEVPVTVARMLKRPLRVHVVGAEKEMNFLDLFKEIGFLLPEDVQVSRKTRKTCI